MNIPQIALDQVESIQHLPKANEVLRALSPLALYGINQRKSAGLNLWLYGGNFPTATGVVAIATQRLTLTPSTTNYIYADTAGAVFKVIAAPTGWPGPMNSGARALYELSVGANSVTSGTCYLVGRGQKGASGPQGAVGDTGAQIYSLRNRWFMIQGFNAVTTSGSTPGIDVVPVGGGTMVATPEDSSDFVGGVVRASVTTATSIANASGGRKSTSNQFSMLRGFDVSFRFGIDGSAATHHQQFHGLYDLTPGDPTPTTAPSAQINIIGVGADDGDQTLYLMHNDGSGSATKVLITSTDSPTRTFASRNPSGAVARIYEFRLQCAPGASTVDYTFSDVTPGFVATATGSIGPSNMPSSFLGLLTYANTGAIGGANASFKLAQIIASTRY